MSKIGPTHPDGRERARQPGVRVGIELAPNSVEADIVQVGIGMMDAKGEFETACAAPQSLGRNGRRDASPGKYLRAKVCSMRSSQELNDEKLRAPCLET